MGNVDLIIKKLEKIENEIHTLKFSLKQSQKPLKLGGIWTKSHIIIETTKQKNKQNGQ
ncbi:MAG: hypothetical protein ACE5JB_01615 [bacterium]